MKIWAISDTHDRHNELVIPNDIDMVIHCGDEANYSIPALNAPECLRFLEWYSSLDIKHKMFVPGNHSTSIFHGLISKDFIKSLGIIYLENTSIQINDLNIYGSPYTPSFGKDWAFMKKRGRLTSCWDMIPKNTDILITHGPPKTKLDLTDDMNSGNIVQVGCKELLNKVLEIKPLYHMFVHIHDSKFAENYGILRQNGIFYINSAVCSHHKKEIHNGHIIDI